ncbi:MAG: Gfo/Idh/MocA family oxidoreductase [Verrucomicrobiota bacterium]
MPDTIPVGVFTDVGGAHLGAYFAGLAACKEAENVVLCDPSGHSVEQAKKALGDKLAAVFDDPAKALNNAVPKLAVVSLEARHAPPIINQVLDAGCDVFAEKPSCVRAEDFEKLVAKADSNQQLLMFAFSNRLNPPVLKARQLIEAGTFGDPYSIEVHMVADQTRLTRESYQKAWYTDRDRSGGGILTWLGIHWLDLAMLFLNSRVTDVSGFMRNAGGQPINMEDSVAMTMRFENGVCGTMNSGYYLDKGYHSHIRLWGSKGWIEYADWLGGANPNPLIWYTTVDGMQEWDGAREPRGYTPWIRECVRASAGLRSAPISAQEGLNVIKAIFAYYESANSGMAVKVYG